MQKKSRFLAVVMAVTLLAGITITTAPSVGAGLGGILKGAGLVLLVDKFGNQLNDFINKVTFNKGVGVEDRTKVVPIISIGQGAYAGAAQVSGPAAQIDKVKAVAQFETNMAGKTFRIKALVPVESKDVVKNLKRVSGVGVSAMIDVRL